MPSPTQAAALPHHPQHSSEKAEESSEKPCSSESKESEATEEESVDEGDDESETTEADKQGEDEEPFNLQLAWVMLKLAMVCLLYTSPSPRDS